MQIQGSSDWRPDGGVLAKKDLRILGIFTAVISCVGLSQLLFQSGGAVLLILLVLLSVVWLYVLWRRFAKQNTDRQRLPERLRVDRTQRLIWRDVVAPSLSKYLVVGFVYIAALCGAGTVATGRSMGTVVLVTIAVLSLIGALITFLFGQASRSRSGQV